MKSAKSGRIVAIAFVLALGLAGSIYAGYWSKMERYVTSIVSPTSVEVPAWVKSAGFNASLLPNIACYATVLGLFAALVRLVDLLRKKRISARNADARLAAGAATVPAAGAARAPAGGAAGAAAGTT